MTIFNIAFKQKSFTLPEIIIAMCLMSIVCVFSFTAFTQFSKYLENIKIQSRIYSELYTLDLLLNTDLFCAKVVCTYATDSLMIIRIDNDTSKYIFNGDSILIRVFRFNQDTIFKQAFTLKTSFKNNEVYDGIVDNLKFNFSESDNLLNFIYNINYSAASLFQYYEGVNGQALNPTGTSEDTLK